jgi:hypothetical protein
MCERIWTLPPAEIYRSKKAGRPPAYDKTIQHALRVPHAGQLPSCHDTFKDLRIRPRHQPVFRARAFDRLEGEPFDGAAIRRGAGFVADVRATGCSELHLFKPSDHGRGSSPASRFQVVCEQLPSCATCRIAVQNRSAAIIPSAGIPTPAIGVFLTEHAESCAYAHDS